MAAIYLRHPVHGDKVACGEFEAEYDELSGWERYDPFNTEVDENPEVPDFLQMGDKPKRGRPAKQ